MMLPLPEDIRRGVAVAGLVSELPLPSVRAALEKIAVHGGGASEQSVVGAVHGALAKGAKLLTIFLSIFGAKESLCCLYQAKKSGMYHVHLRTHTFAFFRAGEYITLNLSPRVPHGLKTSIIATYEILRPHYKETDVWGRAVRQWGDANSTSLLEAGGEGCGTGFHRDNTETRSLALGLRLDESNPQNQKVWSCSAKHLTLHVCLLAVLFVQRSGASEFD